jgi:hypothetical protein
MDIIKSVMSKKYCAKTNKKPHKEGRRKRRPKRAYYVLSKKDVDKTCTPEEEPEAINTR